LERNVIDFAFISISQFGQAGIEFCLVGKNIMYRTVSMWHQM